MLLVLSELHIPRINRHQYVFNAAFILNFCRGTSSKADAGTDMDIIGSFHPEHNRMYGSGRGVQVRRQQQQQC
jgi:hypothetical protein